jgi:hypothetical protein
MSNALRLSFAGCVALVALALTGPAAAAYTPTLIAGGATNETTVRLTFLDTDDPTARVVIYVPSAYQLGKPAVGAKIGTGSSAVIAKDLKNAKLTYSGSLTVTDPTTSASRIAASQCTNTPSHEQIWSLSLTATGQTPVQQYVFVDRTNPGESTLGGVKLQLCLRSPDVPATAGGQPLGGKTVDLRLQISGVFRPPATAGDYLWRSLLTPFLTGTGVADASEMVEAQSILRVPRAVKLKAKRIGKTRSVRGERRTAYSVMLTGQVSEGGTRLGGVTVEILRDGHRVRTVKTNEAAGFSARFALRASATFQIRAVVTQRSTSCQGTTVAPAGCTGATVANWVAQSESLRVLKPKARAKH